LDDDFARRGDAWGAARRLIGQERLPLTGTGPGMSAYWLPRHVGETAGTVPGASSAPLEMWAEGGIFVAAAFLAGGVFVVLAVRRWWRTTKPEERDAPHQPDPELPLEYYVGGMAGVLIAFTARASLMLQEDLWPAALLASLGALSWFAAFAVFEQLAWTRAERMVALMAGSAALAAALLVNPGWSMPSLTGLLFIVLGLMLAQAESSPVRWLGHPGLGAAAPLPVLLAVSFSFLLFVVAPAAVTVAAHRRAKLDLEFFDAEVRKPAMKDPFAVLDQAVIKPLREAEEQDKSVVRTCVLLAEAYFRRWSLDPKKEEDAKRAEGWALLAARANREAAEGLRSWASVLERQGRRWAGIAAQRAGASQDKALTAGQRKRAEAEALQARITAAKRFDEAKTKLKDALRLEPTEPRLRFEIASLASLAGDLKERREQAEEAKRLDGLVRGPRRLSNPQREAVEEWLKEETKK
ncbi:MAG: hypothetical protein K2W96_06590, partial [Gemmataceae bacterium]|nr:hypothetical protein [Gemmataceae bacterium]